jgi:hypothetical protein
MDREKLQMYAADGALVGVLLALGLWKQWQPPLWKIITADEWWFGPGPLLIVAGGAIAAAVVGVGVAMVLRPREGLLPFVLPNRLDDALRMDFAQGDR